MLTPNTTLRNRYLIQSFLGRGGMADVYLALDQRRQARVAIKVLREDLAEDPEFVRRFRREAEALARLDHPYIVRFYAFEREGVTAFIVMDYVPGSTLRRHLMDVGGPLPLPEITHILQNVSSALHYAHNEGFVHRDIKPGNIMLREDGAALLADFGIARVAETATMTMGAVGTPAYMSPEQILGQKVDHRTDIYSLGVVLYQMVTGVRPFRGHTGAGVSTIDKIRYEHLHASPPDPRAANPALPEAAAQVIRKALAKKPIDRWQTTVEMERAWKQAVGEKVARQAAGVTFRPPPKSAPPPRESLTSAPARLTPTAPVSPNSWEQNWKLWGGVGAAAIIALLLLFIFWPRTSSESSTAIPSPTGSTPRPTITPASAKTPVDVDATVTAAVIAANATAEVLVKERSEATRQAMENAIAAEKTAQARPQATATARVQKTPTPMPPAVSTDRVVNVRSGPGTAYPVVGKAQPGATYPIIGKNPQNDWWQIDFNGKTGWVAATVVNDHGATGSVQVVSNIPPPPTPKPKPTQPSRPRINFAFVGAYPGNREIFVFYEGDDSPHRLTNAEGNDGYPAVSPNRTLIAFEAGRNGEAAGSDIWLMNSDGSNQHRITTTNGIDAQPAFSPDGRQIAFISDRSGEMKIYLMNIDGSNVRRVDAPGWCFGPSFSPDGRQLVFVATYDSKVHHIFVMNLDGSGLRQITSIPAHYENPSFSPDGRAILTQSDQFGQIEIIRINLDGSGLVNLSNNPAEDSQPVYSWDGSQIAFTRVTDSKPHIWMMNSDGGNQWQWTDLGIYGELDPAWAR